MLKFLKEGHQLLENFIKSMVMDVHVKYFFTGKF